MKFEAKLQRLLDSLIEKHPDYADRPRPPRGKIAPSIANASGEHWMHAALSEWTRRGNAIADQFDALTQGEKGQDNLPAETQAQLEEQLEEQRQHLDAAEQYLADIEEKANTPMPPWMLRFGMRNVHFIWERLPQERREGLKHPNAALLEAWLLRPEQIQLDSRETGIIRADLAKMPARYSNDNAALFDLSEFEGAPADETLITSDAQAHLPDLSPQPGALVPVLPFLLWDHNIPASRGRGTPYGLRLWIEAVLSIPPKQPYRRQEFQIRWGEMVDRILGGRNNRRNTGRLWQALHTVHNLRLAWGKPGARTGRAAVQVPDIPQTPTEYGALVRFVIELPPGAGNGPIVYKPFLREIARWSAPAYRAALTLPYLWDKHGARKGRYIQPTRPRFARDHTDRFINRNGQIILAKDGKPITNYMIGTGRNRRLHPDVLPLDNDGEPVPSVQAAARERNPAVKNYPILTPSDLVKLCYPDDTRNQLTPSAQRGRRQRSGEALQEMAERAYLTIEETPNGWRILPPEGWGVAFRRGDNQ